MMAQNIAEHETIAAGQRALRDGRRVVVKLGSSVVCPPDGAGVDEDVLAWVARDVAARHQAGKHTLIVSSGAVAAGRRVLGDRGRPRTLAEQQAFAAIGQSALMAAWIKAFAAHDIPAAQALLTRSDTETRRRWLNARTTIDQLFLLGAVPVINENDTVTTEQLRHGDNDQLAARVAQLAGADALVLLSDVDGLYTADPGRDPNAKRLSLVQAVTPDVEALAAGSASTVGTGGMASKVAAAKLGVATGCWVVVTAGRVDRPVSRLWSTPPDQSPATWFAPATSPRQARKTWIAQVLSPQGRIDIDQGALSAVQNGASILPAGVIGASGDFEKGDCVRVFGPNAIEIGRGLAAYDAREATRLLGARREKFVERIGYQGPNALIHRDDFVLREDQTDDH